MLRNYTPAFNVKLDKIMAITDLQISEELQTGAPSIKYRGNEGPQAPMQMAAGEDPLLVEEYKKYVFEMQEQGLQPMSFEQFKQQAMSGMAEGGRPGYGLGSIIKKITRPVKKVLGSDLGKAALTAAAMYKLGGGNFFGPNRTAGFSPGNILPGFKKFMVGAPGGVSMGGNRGVGQGIMTKGTKGILGAAGKLSPWKAMTAASLIPFTGIGMGEEETLDLGLNIPDSQKFDQSFSQMRKDIGDAVASGVKENFHEVLNKYGLTEGVNINYWEDIRKPSAQGGRAGYYSGGQSIPSTNSLEDARKTAMQDRLGGITEVMKLADLYRQGDVGQMYMNQGGRIGAQEGGIMDLGGMEKDYRNTGGFVDLGAEEKADDVPARLSVNEFVMTADAVRGAGDGDIDKGAERMEDLMEKLESKGKKENMKMAGGGERG